MDINEELKRILGDNILATQETEKELREFNAVLKSQTEMYASVGKALSSQNNALLKGVGSLVTTVGKYDASIKVMQKQQEAHAIRQKAAEDKLRKAKDALINAITASASNEKKKSLAQNYLRAQDALHKVESANKEYATNIKKLKFEKFGHAFQELSVAMVGLTQSINKTQQQFGLMAGQASSLKIENFIQSFKSYVNTIKSFGESRAVTQEQIEAMQAGFQDQFGGVLTAESAEKLAEQAGVMGVSAEQFVKARRTFLTQNMGNVVEAKKAQDKFIAEFTKKGLTSKEAIQSISQYSELLARNGRRFQESFAKAAIDAKKIGVDLSKIDQFGDSIIGDFEGFLESQAELGAMGFELDPSRLAVLAESGDTGALERELRSQLAKTGKNLENLTRSQRLALEGMGLPMSDILKLAGKTPEGTGGEAAKSPEKLQEEANSKLSRIENLLTASGPIATVLGSISTMLGQYLLYRTLKSIAFGRSRGTVTAPTIFTPRNRTRARLRRIRRLPGRALRGFSKLMPSRIGLIIEAITSKLSMFGSTITNLLTKIPGLTKGFSLLGSSVKFIGKGAFTGIFGVIEGFMSARKEGRDRFESAGQATIQGTSTALGAAIGQALIPIPVLGSVIGGWLGNTFGKKINEYFPEFGKEIGIQFSSIIEYANPLLNSLKQLWGTLKEFGSAAGNVIGPSVKIMANIFGNILVFAIKGLALALQPLITTIQFATDIINGTVKFTSSLLSKVPLIGQYFTQTLPIKTGDDVISKPGYGKRALLTPNGMIALNNKDNIIAYADDFMGSKKLPLGSISKMFSTYEQTGLRGVKSSLLNTGLGLLGKRVPGLSDTISAYKEGGVTGVKSSLLNTGLGLLGKRVPGLSGITSAFSAYKEGGIKGALGSLTKGGIGKAIGGAIGTAIPIPGVGTMIGSMLGSKIGKFTGRLFGKGRSRTTETTPQEMQADSILNLPELIGGIPQRGEMPLQVPRIDTSGIEKQLNMFIQALSNVQVHMDGAKVGNLLVTADQVAAAAGVFRAQR